MSKNNQILYLVGIHTETMQSIKILINKQGITKEKIAIMCGGPDWPVSVLSGIMRVNLVEILVSTLPC